MCSSALETTPTKQLNLSQRKQHAASRGFLVTARLSYSCYAQYDVHELLYRPHVRSKATELDTDKS